MKKVFNNLGAIILTVGAATVLAQSGAPSDAQIAGIVVAANTVDVNAGKLAESRSQNKEVKAFGKQMVTDHTGVNKQASALVKKLKVTPEESDTSKKLKENGASSLSELKGKKGQDFDKAYIDNEVAYHQTVIDALEQYSHSKRQES